MQTKCKCKHNGLTLTFTPTLVLTFAMPDIGHQEVELEGEEIVGHGHAEDQVCDGSRGGTETTRVGGDCRKSDKPDYFMINMDS